MQKIKTKQDGFNIKLVAINARYTHSAPALFYIRHELEVYLPEAKLELYQFSINEAYHEVFLRLIAGEPDSIFLSAAIWNSHLMERLVDDITATLPSCQIVVGGPQALIVAEKVKSNPCLVIGEIEGINPKFYNDLSGHDLNGIYQCDFQVVRRKGLVSLYTPDDFHNYLQNRQIYLETSRGCPFSCSYCLSASDVGIYHKPLEQVYEELDLILSNNPRVLRFIDRTFNDNANRALSIWRYLMTKDCDTLFHFEIAPDFFSDETFAFLEELPSGRFQFEIGIQSTNLQTLQAISRKMKPEKVHGIVSRLASCKNIHLHVDLILGLPFETRESFLKSFCDVFAMGAHYIQMGLLKMLPGTPISKQVDEFGYISSTTAPYSVYANRWLDPTGMAELYWFCECIEKFLNNRYFVSLWAYLLEENEDIAGVFLRILAISIKKELFEHSPTQKLLTEILMDWADERDDTAIIKEILRYDWLRTGHKIFPDSLGLVKGEESFVDTKNRLFKLLPDELHGHYLKRDRNRFIKRIIVWTCSDELATLLGLESNNVCFLAQEREQTVHGHQKVLCL
ncbi:MAG: DUF4080 domain-containing protein [Desulfotalea sp.]